MYQTPGVGTLKPNQGLLLCELRVNNNGDIRGLLFVNTG